jgi:hypothetical protein
VKPANQDCPALSPIWDGGSEPDVPWGSGGIDDWGWNAVDAASAAAPSTETSIPTASPKEILDA